MCLSCLDYNFSKVTETEFYTSTVTEQVKHLRVKGVVLKDPQNVIMGFIFIVFDDTENYHKTEEIQYSLAKLKAAVDTGESVIWEYDVAIDKLTTDFSLNDKIQDTSFLNYLKEDRFGSINDFMETLHQTTIRLFMKRNSNGLSMGKSTSTRLCTAGYSTIRCTGSTPMCVPTNILKMENPAR